jgi:transcriptional regulator with XRE-family HTH domain
VQWNTLAVQVHPNLEENEMQDLTGNDLRELRKKYRITRAELAKYLEVSPVTVEKWEQRGEDPIRPKYLEKLAGLTGMGSMGVGAGLIAAPALLGPASILAAVAGVSAISSIREGMQVDKTGELLRKLNKLSARDRNKLFEIIRKMEA